MLIDHSFFKGELHIDGMVISNGIPSITQNAIMTELMYFVCKYETIYLRALLGGELSHDFISYIQSDSKAPVEMFDSLKSRLVTESISPIANYVFYYYLKNKTLKTLEGNPDETSSKNTISSASRKLVIVWNQMVEMNKEIVLWLSKERIKFYSDGNILFPINGFGL